MNDSNTELRIYGEKEMGAILKRATELQYAEPTAPAAEGLTLAELEEVAREAGIDPRYLRRAALERDSGRGDGTLAAKMAGEVLELTHETRVPGELGEDGFERIVEVMHRVQRRRGTVSVLGRTLNWRAETSTGTRVLSLTVTSRDGRTVVRLEENLRAYAANLHVGVAVGGGTSIGLGFGVPFAIKIGSALLAFAAPVGITAAAWVAARAIYRTSVGRKRKEMAEIFAAVVAEVRKRVVEQPALPTSDGNPTEA